MMDAVIVGGGIGGFATAAFLQQQGVQAHVYEQSASLLPVGAGVVLAPNAVRLLRRLGLLAALERCAVKARTSFECRRWADGRLLRAQDMADCAQLYGEAVWLVHRADLLDVLLDNVDRETIHLGYRCIGVEQSPAHVTAIFENGASTEGDLLVAADGIHSTIRELLVGHVPARDSGLCAWRAMIPSELLPQRYSSPTHTVWLGPGRHLVHYPVSAGRLVNVVGITPAAPGETVESWNAKGDPAGFRQEFAGWDRTVRDLLDAVTRVGRWSLLDRTPIDQYAYGQVALLGDAAHPMMPTVAQGAGQAVEDAASLAACLQETSDVSTALTTYNRVRVPRTAQIQMASRGRATLDHLPDGPEQEARDRAFAHEDPLRQSDWLYSYDAQAEAREAAP